MSDSDYKIKDGVIVSSGKFEGEPHWMPDLWARVLDGNSDLSLHDGSTAYDAFVLNEAMSRLTGYRAHPEHYVVIWSDAQGFVSHMTMDQGALDAIEAHSADDSDLMDSDFDDIPTREFYNSNIPFGFDDMPEYESGY